MTDSLAFASIAELAPRLQSGELSPLALTEAMLDRIGRLEPRLNAFITVFRESALEEARTATREIEGGGWRGPLHGIPVAIKDLFATRGAPTTFGSPAYADWQPDFEATVVRRLRAAGAIILGKTNLHELALGTTSANPHYGPVHNPWNLDCHTGGSSGGSAAAVAAGLAVAALGSDTAASIRQPAACCGTVGLKATYGRIGKYGGLPLSWSLDHAGPLTRTVADAALMLNVLAGVDPLDQSTVDQPVADYRTAMEGPLKGLRLGRLGGFFAEDCEAEVADAFDAAAAVLEAKGARIVDITLPMIAEGSAAGSLIARAEAAAFHAASLRRRPGDFSPEVTAALDLGGMCSAVDYLQAQRLRRLVSDKALAAMAHVDALICPTAPVAATPIAGSEKESAARRFRYTLPFNLTGFPAISVPAGFAARGLPIGLQVIARPWDEAMALRVAANFEAATDWHRRHPEM